MFGAKNSIFRIHIMHLHKYQGTGNDFILLDNRTGNYHLDKAQIQQLCDRKFGIGADGLMLLQMREGYDFEMVYYNSDASQGMFCGNGSRCLVAFAHALGAIETNQKCSFLAADGPHEAIVRADGWVEVKMIDVPTVMSLPNGDFFLYTGTVHYVTFVASLEAVEVVETGRAIRYSEPYQKEGVNVNFVEILSEQHLSVATYERGVEDETLACGTGVTACALVHTLRNKVFFSKENKIEVDVKGGHLQIRFERDEQDGFQNVWLCGPAVKVFEVPKFIFKINTKRTKK